MTGATTPVGFEAEKRQRMEGVMIEKIPVEIGRKYTLYKMSGLASTVRREIVVVGVLDSPERRSSGDYRIGAFREFRSQKGYYLQFDPITDLLIPGWGHLPTDEEAYNAFSGNACVNIAGSVDDVRRLVEQNINSNFRSYDIVLAWPHSHMKGDGVPVFSEEPTDHAIVARLRENLRTEESHD